MAPPKNAGPTPDDIMAPAEMKPILAKSKQEPVSAALGVTAGKEGVLLLHKKSKPRKLMGTLRTEAKKIKLEMDNGSMRFGIAEVDTEVDSTLILFRINKEPPGGFEPRIRERVKKAGFAKVQFVVDESLNEESDEEEGETAAAPPSAPPAPPQAATPPPPPPAPPQAAPPVQAQEPDWGGLTSKLAGHIGGIKGVAAADPTLMRPLAKLASEASEAVKGKQDFAAASTLVENLGRAIADAGGGAKPGQQAKPGGPVVYAKSRLAWLATRKRIETDLERLKQEIVDTYADQGLGQELASAYTSWVSPVLSALDERLADALDAAGNAEGEERTKLAAEAHAMIDEYIKFLNGDPRIKELDDNPFVPMSLRDTIGATLNTLSQAVH